ncbi:hypothetical protein FLB_03510 [Flavobacterium succinicans]|uniref:DUF4412 domain-containing protein n=2 Tax=Flavobacterium succinicans TaxID=29536 RepID=A0A199XUE1_9FLAO|nr:hypothetical protein FLB_03510 [Flavobacterium succinicans]
MLVLLLLLISICSFAQKIKIDNGEIKLDEKTVAYIEGKKPNFKISNLDKNYIITVQLKQIVPVPAVPIMEIRNESTGKLNELEFTDGKFNPFNHEKNLVKALIEHNYLNTDGLNKDVLENFINGTPTGVSAKLLGTKNEKDQADQLVNSYQLSIDDAGVIYSIKANNPDPNDKRIGYVKMTSPSNNGELMYEIMDLDNYLIATWFAKAGMVSGYSSFLNQQLFTFDKKVINAKFDNSGNPIGYKMSKDITVLNIVRALITNGYTLQHQGKAAITAMRTEQIKEQEKRVITERSNSANIYEQNGYVIDEKGEKRTGPITAEFESIKAESSSGMADMTAYGKTVVLKYSNEKGREKTEIFKSKNGIRFCLDSGECYLGLKTIGNTMAAAGSLNALSFDFSSFYKILYEKDGYLVLVDPLVPADFIIKIPNQEKGLYTNKSSLDKLKKNITEYLKCDSFVFENYDFKTLDGLVKVLEEYKNNCNK